VSLDAEVFRYRLLADARELRALRTRLRAWLEEDGRAGQQDVDRTLLAVSEVCANAIEHGCRADGVSVVQVRVAAGPRSLAVEVTDRGRWRSRAADPGHRGRGLTMVGDLADRVDVIRAPSGTTVRLTITLDAD
jgi:anti-sigma regulatory factor (Ser/Thr protein kinase)